MTKFDCRKLGMTASILYFSDFRVRTFSVPCNQKQIQKQIQTQIRQQIMRCCIDLRRKLTIFAWNYAQLYCKIAPGRAMQRSTNFTNVIYYYHESVFRLLLNNEVLFQGSGTSHPAPKVHFQLGTKFWTQIKLRPRILTPHIRNTIFLKRYLLTRKMHFSDFRKIDFSFLYLRPNMSLWRNLRYFVRRIMPL